MPATTARARERLVRALIRKHGRPAVRDFLAEVRVGTIRDAAPILGVSAARAGQIAARLGARITTYTLHPEIHRMANPSTGERPS